jgi:hypothetical protein
MATLITLLVLQFNLLTGGTDTTKPVTDAQTSIHASYGGMGDYSDR